jgi:hypothetical protein
MKCVLGIDVGIKTLSLCVMTKEQILSWGVYDLLEDESILCETCGRKAKYTEGFCGSHYKGKKIKKNEIKKKKVKEYTKQELCNKALLFLNELLVDKEDIFSKVTDVIIELQPRFNPKMCFMSNVIFSKFCDYYLNKDVVVKFEKAKNKLKNYSGDKGEFVKNSYKNRKLKSIEYVETELLKFEDEGMSSFFKNLSKRDDASDSYLLCFNSLNLNK